MQKEILLYKLSQQIHWYLLSCLYEGTLQGWTQTCRGWRRWGTWPSRCPGGWCSSPWAQSPWLHWTLWSWSWWSSFLSLLCQELSQEVCRRRNSLQNIASLKGHFEENCLPNITKNVDGRYVCKRWYPIFLVRTMFITTPG